MQVCIVLKRGEGKPLVWLTAHTSMWRTCRGDVYYARYSHKLWVCNALPVFHDLARFLFTFSFVSLIVGRENNMREDKFLVARRSLLGPSPGWSADGSRAVSPGCRVLCHLCSSCPQSAPAPSWLRGWPMEAASLLPFALFWQGNF